MLSYTVHYGYLHTSLKNLLGPVVQYEDTVQGQMSFIFLLRCDLQARTMKL